MWARNIKPYRKLISLISNKYSVAVKEALSKNVLPDLQKFKIGEKFHGFTVKNIQSIPEFRMHALILQHDATGAQYLHLSRDDPNNVFAVNFRTTPMDSTGAPHILEHTVLCGSKLYPIRDPFFKMLNRSLATFMNAMTGPDYTMYPFSTQNETDYRNLQKIYLDAVFRPNIKLLDFMQEGWRLENSNPEDANSDIGIKGVVFNEMKGALSENEHIMMYKTLNALLPDHTYGHISGGDPFVIPNLTWENLKKFHSDHYHPSNAKFYSYGNFPLSPSLEYLDNEYLSKYNRIDINHTVVPTQKRWNEPKRIHIKCRLDNIGQPKDKQNTISISLLMADIRDIYDTFLLQFVSELLVRGPNSPFYKSLVEPKFSGGFTPSTGYDTQTRDSIFTVGLQGMKVELFDNVVDIYDKTLDSVIAEGFVKKHIESVMHLYELGIKHQSSNFGLNTLFSVTPIWNHDGDVIKALKINSLLNKLKENLNQDPEYLQKFIRKYFKDNNHKLIVTMSPDPEYEAKYSILEAKLIKDKTINLTDTDKKDIYQKSLELQKEQKAKQNIDILPTLTMADIKSDVPRDNLTKTFSGCVPTQICKINTNGITYFRGILSTADLTPEQTMMLPLFCYVINKLGTNSMNYLEFDSLVNRKTAGLNFSLHTGQSLHQLHTYEPGIEISSYCLDENVPVMWDLWSQMFAIDELKDVKRFEMLVQLYVTNLTHGIVDMGHVYAMSAAAGLVSGSSYQRDQLTGLQHIIYMKNLIRTSNYRAMLQELSKIARILFDKTKLRCALNVSEKNSDSIYTSYDKFIKNLPGNSLGPPNKNLYLTPKIWSPVDSVHCQHHILTIPVHFCSKSVLTVPYINHNYSKLRVLARLISSKYLHPELRERQGAYGGGAKMTPDGVLVFYSYRDPRHLQTLDVFDGTNDWFQHEMKNITEQDVLEAKLGVFQAVDAPIPPCNRSMEEFSRGLTPEILQRHRSEVMSVNLEQLNEVCNKYLGPNNNVLEGKVILGPKSKELDIKNRKDELWTIMSTDRV